MGLLIFWLVAACSAMVVTAHIMLVHFIARSHLQDQLSDSPAGYVQVLFYPKQSKGTTDPVGLNPTKLRSQPPKHAYVTLSDLPDPSQHGQLLNRAFEYFLDMTDFD